MLSKTKNSIISIFRILLPFFLIVIIGSTSIIVIMLASAYIVSIFLSK